MLENLHFVLGFFVPIALAGGAGYLIGRYHARRLQGLITGTVIAVFPEYHQARVRDKNDIEYAITRHTGGLIINDLSEGQVIEMKVGELGRVLYTQAI